MPVLLATLWLTPFNAAARQSHSLEGVDVGFQYYQWREYADAGARLLTEQGTRLQIGVQKHNLDRPYPGPVYNAQANAWFGTVGYDGHTYNSETKALTPITSVTDYLGASAGVAVGQRFGVAGRGRILDLMAGMQVDTWLRNLRSAYDDIGQHATGYREWYRVGTGRFAAGIYQPLGRGYGYLQVGVKYPFYTSEYVSNVGITLSPGKRPSLYGRLEFLNLLPLIKRRAVLAAYYDTFRFSPSAVKQDIYQPQSHMDVIGLSVVFY